MMSLLEATHSSDRGKYSYGPVWPSEVRRTKQSLTIKGLSQSKDDRLVFMVEFTCVLRKLEQLLSWKGPLFPLLLN